MSLDGRIEDFVVTGREYYLREFRRIQNARKFTITWNTAAVLAGPFWGAWRQMWGFFWVFLCAELFAWVQVARGLWGQALSEEYERHQNIIANIAKRKNELNDLLAKGDQDSARIVSDIISNLERVAEQLQGRLDSASLTGVLVGGLLLLILVKAVEGLYANIAYEKKYSRWLVRRFREGVGTSKKCFLGGIILAIIIFPITIINFSHVNPESLLGFSPTSIPIQKEIFSPVAQAIDNAINWASNSFSGVFGGVSSLIFVIVNAMETILLATPWPVVMIIIVVVAYRVSGLKVALFVVASLAYLALMGLWKMSMITVALIGAGTTFCLAIGIPLGIWFGRNSRAYNATRPVLDFMQTMPSFVYLIPVIAFFGTGKPPGVLATIIFAMPPVVHLSALGIRNVSKEAKEAAVAFGCSNLQLLFRVEIPLAMPSIVAGINQTIMMGLSMVVIASLIGAEGLGMFILEALQYAAKGQGLLGGLAILFCAMVIDRIVRGACRTKHGNQ